MKTTQQRWFKKVNIPECVTDAISRDNNINFLRLVLAWTVVIAHSSLSGHNYQFKKLFDGEIAVCGFFIISGFLIIRSYWSSKSLKDYFIKRCRRLLPAYYFTIVLCMAGLSLLSTLSMDEYFKSPQLLKYFIANAFFMNFLQPSLPGVFSENNMASVNGALWTIKLEIGFYIIVPIIAFILNKCKTKKRINVFLAVLFMSGYVYNFICLYLFRKFENKFIEELAHQLPGYIQYFAVGIFCVINYKLVKKYDKYLIIPAIGILALYYWIGNTYFLPIGLGIIIMFIGFGFSRLNNIGKNGDYSYGVYIFHFPVIQILVALGYFDLNKNVALIIMIATVFSMSYLSWHFLEKKILKR
jgi:peptidoglycan/LPS O-acetylase OafA/YrhL